MLKNNFIQKALFPTTVALATAVSLMVLSSTAKGSLNKDISVQTTHVTALPLERQSHSTVIKGYGEIVPAEITLLSTRVSSTVVYWSEKFVRGGIVEKGEVLFRLEDSRYQAELKNAEADILSAKADLEQELGLAKVAKSELERINSKDRNRLFLREPQIKSAYAAVQSAEARLISAKHNLDSTVIKAPFDALVVERNIGLGQYVAQGNQVAQLYNVESAEILVPVAKFDSRFLPENNQDIAVKVRLPYANLTTQAHLSRQLRLTDSLTRTNSVVVIIKELYQHRHGGLSFQFGDYVEVEFSGRAIDGVYKVPEYLVSNNQVWIMNQNNALERREVSVVRNENGYAIIDGGFELSDKLVTSVPEYPYQGMPVKLMMAGSTDKSRDRL